MSKQQVKAPAVRFVLAAAILALVVAAIACGGGAKGYGSPAKTPAAGTKTPAATSSAGASAVQIKMIPTMRFDKTSLTIAANTDVTVSVDNTDAGTPHNFAVFKSKGDPDAGKPAMAESKVCTAPCQETLTLHLAPGEYFFHCNIHPTKMTGTLTAQ